MITIKNGKFIKNGDEVPAEFGNVEQIAALMKHEVYLKKLNEGLDLDPTIEYTYRVDFKCFCGATIYLEADGQDEEDNDCLAGIIKKCRCGKHTFKTYMDSGFLMVRSVVSMSEGTRV